MYKQKFLDLCKDLKEKVSKKPKIVKEISGSHIRIKFDSFDYYIHIFGDDIIIELNGTLGKIKYNDKFSPESVQCL